MILGVRHSFYLLYVCALSEELNTGLLVDTYYFVLTIDPIANPNSPTRPTPT